MIEFEACTWKVCVDKQFRMNYFLVEARILRNSFDYFRVQTL